MIQASVKARSWHLKVFKSDNCNVISNLKNLLVFKKIQQKFELQSVDIVIIPLRMPTTLTLYISETNRMLNVLIFRTLKILPH